MKHWKHWKPNLDNLAASLLAKVVVSMLGKKELNATAESQRGRQAIL